jgi:hypothetical protein
LFFLHVIVDFLFQCLINVARWRGGSLFRTMLGTGLLRFGERRRVAPAIKVTEQEGKDGNVDALRRAQQK